MKRPFNPQWNNWQLPAEKKPTQPHWPPPEQPAPWHQTGSQGGWNGSRKPSPPANPPWKDNNKTSWNGSKTQSDWGASKPASETRRRRRADYKPFQRVFIESSGNPYVDNSDPAEIQAVRDDLLVSVEGEAVDGIAPIRSFDELGVLPDYVTQALQESERTTPMPIQAQALPIILAGHDLIGIAKTGSGKTLAFLLPAIVHIEAQKALTKEDSTPIVLILAPTRELVQQIADEAGKLLQWSSQGSHAPRGIWAQEVYGGKQRAQQLAKAKGAALIAATPGRLTDFIESGDLSLDRITYFVLDEADRMLDMGFSDEMQKFSSQIRPDRHTLFFSATWPKQVQELACGLCQNSKQPAIIRVGQSNNGAGATRADIVQKVVVFDEDDWAERENKKKELLYSHLRETLETEGTKVLVFVSSKTLADELATTLGNEGFSTDSMHGGRKQWDRDEVLARFKRDEFRLLVATDVMGRGLDIPTITHVVIFDMGDIDDYIHRIGRTARGNVERLGHALTLFEYNKKWPELAGGLVKVLEDSGQEAPEGLRRIAEEVEQGLREVVDRNTCFNKPSKSARARLEGADRKFDDEGKPICKFFLEGCCTKADWCDFSHGQPAAGGGAKKNGWSTWSNGW